MGYADIEFESGTVSPARVRFSALMTDVGG
jgi:hypothetical protein